MTQMSRLTVGDLDLSVIDPHERDTRYIYDEIFVEGIYDNANFRISPNATIMDVGANIGLYSIWVARRYEPAAIFAYEASPVTFGYLVDNVGRHVDQRMTRATCVNRAVSSRPGLELVLKQAPLVSGISTVLDEASVPWARQLRSSGELTLHKTISTTVSEELARNAIGRVGILKIDVEGHFMEVLAGISPADFGRIANIVLEADYLDVLGLSLEQICAFLRERDYAIEVRDQTIYAWH